ncbi:DUF6766 family protein [Streptomyces sp. NPDC001890]|uniref:DUF6766 family protein n=1 Tax=Streptomyces sp. NPDC001890 TaxID=3364620 RepID=UPI00368113E8
MASLFLLSWLAHSIAGAAAYNEQQLHSLQAPISWGSYLASAGFWSRSLQNWQSALLAVACMATFSVTCADADPRNPNPSGHPTERRELTDETPSLPTCRTLPARPSPALDSPAADRYPDVPATRCG